MRFRWSAEEEIDDATRLPAADLGPNKNIGRRRFVELALYAAAGVTLVSHLSATPAHAEDVLPCAPEETDRERGPSRVVEEIDGDEVRRG